VSAFFQRVPREEHAYVREQMAAVVREAKPFSFEHSIIRPDGTRRFVHEQGDCIVDANTGRITVFHGTLQDVTERKRAQQALARSEADFRQLFAESPLPMWVQDHVTLPCRQRSRRAALWIFTTGIPQLDDRADSSDRGSSTAAQFSATR
jgi:PAS domain-containing protein